MYKIAICGKANSGKNTIAELFCDAVRGRISEEGEDVSFGPTWFKGIKFLAFADPIKEMIRTAYPEVPRKWLYGSSKFRSKVIPGAFKNGVPLTVRQLLIDLGNDFGRANKPDIWLRNFDHRLAKALKKNPRIVVVTDTRFRNEFDHLKSLGFYQIRLLRDSHLKIDDISETNQDGIADSEFEAVIHNNGTLEELGEKVKKIVSELKP